jgi:hypothetical protein
MAGAAVFGSGGSVILALPDLDRKWGWALFFFSGGNHMAERAIDHSWVMWVRFQLTWS